MTRELVLSKETKNTYVYVEDLADDEKPVAPVIYIQKSALSPNKPQRIRVTIEEVSAS